jgi:non-heme Fe2+,alpha-ketoglutarate-dependent halogenase
MASTDFPIIPEQQQLAEVPRELRFYPCENQHPTTLTRGHIEQFNRAGYLSAIPIFTRDEADGHRRYFDDLLSRVLAAGGNSYSISTAHLKYGMVYDLLTEPRLVAVVSDLLGENVVAWGSHFFCKMPGDGQRVAWHQDASYWPLSPSKTVTVWLAIDDANRTNACMRFIPGTHHLGHLPYRTSEAGEHNTLDQTVEDAERFGTPVDVELRAGEISVHADLLLHGSEANHSERRRCGLTLRYCAAEVRAGLGWNAKGVIVRGADPSGHWANPPRPAKD